MVHAAARVGFEISQRDRAIIDLARRKLRGAGVDFADAIHALQDAAAELISGGRVFWLGAGEVGPIVGSIISGIGIAQHPNGREIDLALHPRRAVRALEWLRAVKSDLGFDPRAHTYEPLTESIRATLLEWSEIDWFEPTRTSDEESASLMREHDARARAYAPELYPETTDVRIASGGWAAFEALCKCVRTEDAMAWDWKCTVLKRLSHKHAEAHGWTFEAEARRTPARGWRDPPGKSELFVRLVDERGREILTWQASGGLDGIAALPRESVREVATFYFSYAQNDRLDCIKWQLAAATNDLGDNPFWPLLLCYRAGFCPFSVDARTMILFRFDADALA